MAWYDPPQLPQNPFSNFSLSNPGANWSKDNFMNWSGNQADFIGQQGPSGMKPQDSSLYRTIAKGEDTLAGAGDKKGLKGAFYTMGPEVAGAVGTMENVSGNNWNQYYNTPGGQMQRTDANALMNLVGGGPSEKDQAPEAPKDLVFDPNAYRAGDYTGLRKAMMHNAERQAYEQKKQAKAGGQVGSADFAANQAAIQQGLGESGADIANQIAGLETQDKLNAYQNAVNDQWRKYDQSMTNWKERVGQEQSNLGGALGRVGTAASIASSFIPGVGPIVSPLISAGANQVNQKQQEQYNNALRDASTRRNDSLYNQVAQMNYAKSYKTPQKTYDSYGSF